MEFMTNIVAAEEDEYTAIGESTCPLDEWSGIEAPGLDTVKVAILHCLLTGDPLQMALDLYEPVYVTESETVVLRIAEELLEKLAVLDEEALENVASELAATEDFESEQWEADDVLAQLTELADLAQLAESQGQALFVWMSLVQD
ncbi:MAG: hypothetical protein JNM42_15375 [Propionivibrio sp.]|uniref:hypothetical protein n=1 Tax=Propionivibrio sp. TaxID=2212460 RepID=UPI001A4ACC30|nr:hypothetical protein [Propionivibrio sp.]MBL8415815.1 hypothetical protein [Propionivibrio sp.]